MEVGVLLFFPGCVLPVVVVMLDVFSCLEPRTAVPPTAAGVRCAQHLGYCYSCIPGMSPEPILAPGLSGRREAPRLVREVRYVQAFNIPGET